MLVSEIPTPALLLDRGILERNLRAMSGRMQGFGVDVRPHMKTAKSTHIAQMATAGHRGGITVSTLHEAAYFAEAGFRDITYAIGIAPDKLPIVSEVQASGARVNLLTDDVGIAEAIVRASDQNNEYSVLIDVDTGYHRSGVLPESDNLLAIAHVLDGAANVHLLGVLTHAGHSYDAPDTASIARIAEEERSRIVVAAQRIRDAGIACPTVSVGSTPTMRFVEGLDGVTEVRPGNYVFYDVSMCGRGVCAVEDIAVSVLTEVIVNLPDRNRVLVDAGALAISQDRSADSGTIAGAGFGILCDIEGQPLDDVVVAKVSQEHGWLGVRTIDAMSVTNGFYPTLPHDALAIGSRWRVLPIHSCMTSAAYSQYYVVDGGAEVVDVWPRVNGW